MQIILDHESLVPYLLDLKILKEEEIQYTKVDVNLSVNHYWILECSYSTMVVKQGIEYKEYFSQEFMLNEIKKSKLISSLSKLVYSISHYDERNSIVIYIFSKDSFILKRASEKLLLSEKIAIKIGENLSHLHQLDKSCDLESDIKCKSFFYTDYILSEVKPETGITLPVEILLFLKRYQRDAELINSVVSLKNSYHTTTLIHNNLKFKNILVNSFNESNFLCQGCEISFINLERSCYGDIRYDLGSIIGEYLLCWLNSIPFTLGMALSTSLKQASIPLEKIQPLNTKFLDSYLSSHSTDFNINPELISKIIKYSGLYLIYYIIEFIEENLTFDTACTYIFQIAKSLLCKTEKATVFVFGITEKELISKYLLR